MITTDNRNLSITPERVPLKYESKVSLEEHELNAPDGALYMYSKGPTVMKEAGTLITSTEITELTETFNTNNKGDSTTLNSDSDTNPVIYSEIVNTTEFVNGFWGVADKFKATLKIVNADKELLLAGRYSTIQIDSASTTEVSVDSIVGKVILQDTRSGNVFVMFYEDFVKMACYSVIDKGEVTGEFEFIRRFNNSYGIAFIPTESDMLRDISIIPNFAVVPETFKPEPINVEEPSLSVEPLEEISHVAI